jgi:DNA-directed RNA polymerase sigma subunit (sigma70/sigma32)
MKRQLNLSRTEVENLITEWIFNARDRDILRRRILDGRTFEELSEEFHLSTQRTKAIVYNALDTLHCHL